LVDKSGKSLIRVIELPMQFGAEGENFTIKQEGSDRILGNIMSKNINLLFKPQGAIVSAAQNILEAGGKSLHNATVQGLDAGIRATLGSSQRVELDASGACWFIPVGQRALSMYSIDKTSAPDKLELYAHPYYQTDLRVTVTQTGPNYATRIVKGGPQQPDGDDVPAMIESYEANSENQNSPLRVFPRGAAVASVQHWNRLTSQFEYVTEVDIPALIRLAAKSGIPNLQSVYVSSSYPVVLREGKKLTSKFSFVSNNDVYVPTSFGKDGKAFSVIAPHFYYGRPGYPVDSVKYVGQRVITSQAKDANGMPYPATAIDGLGTTLSPGKKQYSMTPIQRMQDLPPVYLKNWLIYLDAEYGNN